MGQSASSNLSRNLIRDLSKGLLGDSDQSETRESNEYISIFEPDNSNCDFGNSGDNVKDC